MTWISEPLVAAEGMLLEDPIFGRLPGGAEHAICLVRLFGPVGESPLSNNPIWPVLVLRPPAVELMRAALPGDILHLLGAVQVGRLLVPRTDGRIDVLLSG